MKQPARQLERCARRRALGAVFVVACVAGPSGAARAKPEFPPDIARHLSASVAPACSVCHLEGKTNGITVATPFALALRAHGFTDSEDTLNGALDQMATDGTDTDGDGVSDIDELRAGTDPGSPVPGATTADPSYGCGVAAQARRGGWAGVLLAAVALVLRRRTRR